MVSSCWVSTISLTSGGAGSSWCSVLCDYGAVRQTNKQKKTNQSTDKNKSLSSGCCNKKYHRLGSLNSKYLFCTVLDPGKSTIKVLAELMSGEDLLPGPQMTSQSREVREAPWVSFIRTWISFTRAPSNDLSKTPPSNTVTFRLKNFDGIQSIAQSYCENHKGTKHHPLPANMSDYCFITNYSFNHAFIFSPSR